MYDPNEEFVVVSIYRSTVAELFNGVIDENEYNINYFARGDRRLPYELCEKVANIFSDAIELCDSDEDRGAYEREEVKKLFDATFLLTK